MILGALVVYLAVAVRAQDTQGYRLVWEDNFDSFDPTKWQHEVTAWGGGNGEFQVYVPDTTNTYAERGVLKMKPTLLKDNINPKTGRAFGDEFLRTGSMNLWDLYGKCTNDNNWGCFREGVNIPPIASGRIRTKDKFSFKYGKIEFRAKMPGGDWMWPAIWLLPEKEVYGGWPASGEIDIVEIMGNRDLKKNGHSEGQDKMGSTLHWGIDPGQNKYFKTTGHKYNSTHTYANEFHTYVLEWNENGFRYSLDGQQYLDIPNPLINNNPNWKGFYELGKPWRGSNNPWAGRGNMAPFDQDFHFVMNVAVGGTGGYIPDGAINHGGRYNKPWRNDQSWTDAKNGFYNNKNDWLWTWDEANSAMQVDYIRVYKR